MNDSSLHISLFSLLSTVFFLLGAVLIVSPKLARAFYKDWDADDGFFRRRGALALLAALLLAIPDTRYWGMGLSCALVFLAVTLHLGYAHYTRALPCLALLGTMLFIILMRAG